MITGIIGLLGAGKTLTLILQAYKAYLEKEIIFTNIASLKIPNIYINDIIQLGAIEEGVVIFDELQLFADSRRWFTAQNKAFNSFLYMSRKKGLDFYYTSAVMEHTDIRIRELTDYILKPSIIKDKNNKPVALKIVKYCAITYKKINTTLTRLDKPLKPFNRHLYNLYNTNENMTGYMQQPEIYKSIIDYNNI